MIPKITARDRQDPTVAVTATLQAIALKSTVAPQAEKEDPTVADRDQTIEESVMTKTAIPQKPHPTNPQFPKETRTTDPDVDSAIGKVIQATSARSLKQPKQSKMHELHLLTSNLTQRESLPIIDPPTVAQRFSKMSVYFLQKLM